MTKRIEKAAEVARATMMGDLRHELVDAQGDVVLVVLTNSDKYLGESRKVQYDKDQKELPVNEPATQPGKEPSNDEPPHDQETGEVDEEEGDDLEENDDAEDDEDEDDDE